jgi:ADP-heptose:LPS heptosyltransferase
MPFLRAAAEHAEVTLLAKPHAAPLLARFAPTIEHLPFTAPWTAFRGKYRLHRWPWAELRKTVRELRRRGFQVGVSARRDPRDHFFLWSGGIQRRLGFPRGLSRALLTDTLTLPARTHRAEHWRSLAAALGWQIPAPVTAPRTGRHIVIHTGAAQRARTWPAERFAALAGLLRSAGWQVTLLDRTDGPLDELLAQLANADRFIGNDSGPGHLAALLGVPTFTIFGPQLPELFAPQHPNAAWIEGAACVYKPCFDSCRFAEPHCILENSVDAVWARVHAWLAD